MMNDDIYIIKLLKVYQILKLINDHRYLDNQFIVFTETY